MLFGNIAEFRLRVFTLAYYVSGSDPREIGTLTNVCTCGGKDFRAGLRGLHTGCPSVKWDKAFALLISCIALLRRERAFVDPEEDFAGHRSLVVSYWKKLLFLTDSPYDTRFQ